MYALVEFTDGLEEEVIHVPSAWLTENKKKSLLANVEKHDKSSKRNKAVFKT